jgi:hypothetical protein
MSDICLPLEYLFNGIKFFPGGDCAIVEGEIVYWGRQEPQPTIEQIEAARIPAAADLVTKQIKAERDKRKFEGVIVGAHRFHSDPDSRTQQLGLVILGANIPPGLQWKTIGGTFVTMTQTLAGQIFGATAARDTAMFANAEAHIATVQAMTDAEAVLAYDYSTGWPE